MSAANGEPWERERSEVRTLTTAKRTTGEGMVVIVIVVVMVVDHLRSCAKSSLCFGGQSGYSLYQMILFLQRKP
jgi:hypothetical protein